jgi:CubicO group peptidase (beta-lactamase class C family)
MHRFFREKNRVFGHVRFVAVPLATVLVWFLPSARGAEIVFPGTTWDTKSPRELGIDEARLDAVAAALEVRGCAIKNGYIVKAWGAQDQISDWFSSAKPVLSTLLVFAAAEGRIKNFDKPLIDFGWELSPKDRTMTLRHLASMTSGYARPEEPGRAWAYNDYAIQLYQKSLFDKIFQGAPESVTDDSMVDADELVGSAAADRTSKTAASPCALIDPSEERPIRGQCPPLC